MTGAIFNVEMLKLLTIIHLPMACIPAYIAKKKGRSFFLWYLYGYLLFFFALIHSLMLLPKNVAERMAAAQPQYSDIPNNIQMEIIINTSRINYCLIGCPMDTLSYLLISNPAARTITAKLNLFAEKPIKAFDITLEMLDSMKGKIADKTFNNVSYADTVDFDISDYPYTMYVNFTIEHIYLENGEEWVRNGERLEYDIDILDGYEQEKLKALTNKYAVCLPYEHENYWICTCSKANNDDTCVMCGISKEELFEKIDKNTILQLKNDLIRRNNLRRFNVANAQSR